MTGRERIEVAAGILADRLGRILLCERLGDPVFAGLWEFPGGKCRPGEAAAAAMLRELDEELGIAVQDYSHFMRVQHDYEQLDVGIDFYLVTGWRGTPRGRDGQRLVWRHPDDIAAGELLPADEPVLVALRESLSAAGIADQP